MAHDAIDPVKEEIARLEASLLGKKDDVSALRATMLGELKNLQSTNESRIDTAEQIARKCRDSRSGIAAAEVAKAAPKGPAVSGSAVKASTGGADTDLTSKFAALRNGASGGR